MEQNNQQNDEQMEKAYTQAGVITAGTNWDGTAPTNSMRGQLGSGSAETLLTDAERNFLLDQVVDESKLLNVVRKLTMNRSRVEIPRMSIGTRIMRAAQQGGHAETYPYYGPGSPAFNPVLPSNAAGSTLEQAAAGSVASEHLVSPNFGSVVLESSKFVVPWSVTEEFLEDNPEKGAAEQRIITMMGIQASNDLEDVALNGDITSTDALLRGNDGYLKQITASGNVVAWSAAFSQNTLGTMLRNMPTKYRRDVRRLRFIVGPDIYQDYVESIAARQGAMADQYLAGMIGDPTFAGIPVMMSPFMPDGSAVLVDPENLIFGVERNMELRKTTEGQSAIYNDERYYALHLRCDFVVQNPAASVIATGITPRVF